MTDPSAAGYGKLTDEGMARARQRIGVYQKLPNIPHNFEVTWDGSRHFAYGFGDDNPLFCDPEYAKNTRWGSLIAPPTFLYTMGQDDTPPQDPETKQLLRGDPFAGLGSYQAVMYFEWWKPLKLGDRLKQRRALVGVQRKRSDFGGETAHETLAMGYVNQDGEPVAIQRGTWIHAERDPNRERKVDPVQGPYTKEQLAEVDAAYEAELGSRRGGETRYWEDVEVGETLPTRVKGPMKTTDIIVFHLGWGMQLTPPGAHVLAYKVRKKAPGLYPPNSRNIPDTVQRLHWEPERAAELGIPMSYDYGGMRETFLCHIVTDWMGDDGWLWKFTCQHRRFVYMYDTDWVKGRVIGKQQVDGRNEVELEIWVENQNGVVTSPGNATVLLPSRSGGPVVIPEAPAKDMDGLYAHEIARLAE